MVVKSANSGGGLTGFENRSYHLTSNLLNSSGPYFLVYKMEIIITVCAS